MKLPSWFVQAIPDKNLLEDKFSFLESLKLATVCKNARCPNIGICFENNELAFMILGNSCTRRCKFCAVDKNKGPLGVDNSEPEKIARAVSSLKLDYVVVTSVSRDDLEDFGASVFADTIRQIKISNPSVKLEVLIPDFQGVRLCLDRLIESGPDVIAHNVETVSSLFASVRDLRSSYKISLGILEYVKNKNPGIFTKSSLMLGMGETKEEVLDVMRDLSSVGCDIITVGQYLSPGEGYYPVREFVAPGEFEYYQDMAYSFGFKATSCGALVRSSYKAKELFKKCTSLLLSEPALQV